MEYRTINVKWPTKCKGCSAPIPAGARVTWAPSLKAVWHPHCSPEHKAATGADPLADYAAPSAPATPAPIVAPPAPVVAPAPPPPPPAAEPPSGWTYAPECWAQLDAVMPALGVAGGVRRALLYGPPGTGKSYFGFALAAARALPHYAVTVHEEMSATELIGHYIIRGGDTAWHDGPALRWWRAGGVLVINEVNLAGGDLVGALHGLLDDDQSARMDLPTGETVDRHPGCVVVCTMNGQQEDLMPALLDRMDVRVEVTAGAPGAILRLPADIRQAAATSVALPESDARRLSLRPWIRFAALRALLPEDVAARTAFGARGEEILSGLKIAGAEL